MDPFKHINTCLFHKNNSINVCTGMTAWNYILHGREDSLAAYLMGYSPIPPFQWGLWQ